MRPLLVFAVALALGCSVPVASTIDVTPAGGQLASIGATLQLSAKVLDANGAALDGAALGWSSENAATATVNADGLVTAVANGDATIVATSGGASAKVVVHVAQGAATIELSGEAPLTSFGATVLLSAVVRDAGGAAIAGAPVGWSSSDEAVATVDASGLVTAVANGDATITATSGDASATVVVHVEQLAATVAISSDVTLASLGASASLTAVVRDAGGSAIVDAPLSWTSGDEAIATVDADGVVTALANGDTNVTATSGSAFASVDVHVAQTAASLELDADNLAFASLGLTSALSALVRDAGGSPLDDPSIDWSSSDEAVASVDAVGLVTALTNGDATITATSGDASATVEVHVAQVGARITFASSEATLTSLGATTSVTASVVDAGGSPMVGPTFTWSSSDATIATVDANGLVTAVAPGDAAITATSGDLHGAVEVHVTQVPASMRLSTNTVELASIGATAALSATVFDAGGTSIDDARVDWKSDDESIATVDGDGVVTSRGNGDTTIDATVGALSASATVHVEQLAAKLDLTPAEVTLSTFGATEPLTATVRDALGTPLARPPAVTFATSDPTVARVDASGLVRAVANGDGVVTATSGELSATSSITVAGLPAAVPPYSGTLTATPTELVADGASTSLATLTIVDSVGQPVPNAAPSFATTPFNPATPSATVSAVVDNGDGTYTATVTAGLNNGTASLQAWLPSETSALAQVALTFSGGNNLPTAAASTVHFAEDSSHDAITLFGSDADGNALTAHIVRVKREVAGTLVDGAGNDVVGGATLAPPTVFLTPNRDQFGDVVVDYTLDDGKGQSSEVEEKIVVDAVVDPPIVSFGTTITLYEDAVDASGRPGLDFDLTGADIEGKPFEPFITGSPDEFNCWDDLLYYESLTNGEEFVSDATSSLESPSQWGKRIFETPGLDEGAWPMRLVPAPDEWGDAHCQFSFEFKVIPTGTPISADTIVTFNVLPVNDAPETAIDGIGNAQNHELVASAIQGGTYRLPALTVTDADINTGPQPQTNLEFAVKIETSANATLALDTFDYEDAGVTFVKTDQLITFKMRSDVTDSGYRPDLTLDNLLDALEWTPTGTGPATLTVTVDDQGGFGSCEAGPQPENLLGNCLDPYGACRAGADPSTVPAPCAKQSVTSIAIDVQPGTPPARDTQLSLSPAP